MHNAAFAALGLNWRYLAFEVDPKNLRAAIEGSRAMNFAGLNLTVPHKLLAMDMVDELDISAKTWGAVNTIKFEPDAAGKVRAIGFNTDADAVVRTIKDDFKWSDLNGAAILLLGAGGAAKSTALRLAQEGISKLFLVNRTETNALQLKRETEEQNPSVLIEFIANHKIAEGYPHDPVDLVVNATSLGLKPDDALPIQLNWLKTRRPKRVFDMIYRPAETAFLREAKAASITAEGYSACQTANGIGMLVHQGAKAFEIWTGQTPPLNIMREAVEMSVYGETLKS